MSVLVDFLGHHDRYIETGIGHGQSLAQAVRHGFADLHAIEIDQKLVDMARGQFADIRHLTIHHGSSPDVLPEIMTPDVQTLFWLDAHFSAGLYTGDAERDRQQLDARFGECPLLAELAAIRAVDWLMPPTILIDDATCFTASAYVGHHAAYTRAAYPTVTEIQAALPTGYHLHEAEAGTGVYFRCLP